MGKKIGERERERFFDNFSEHWINHKRYLGKIIYLSKTKKKPKRKIFLILNLNYEMNQF